MDTSFVPLALLIAGLVAWFGPVLAG